MLNRKTCPITKRSSIGPSSKSNYDQTVSKPRVEPPRGVTVNARPAHSRCRTPEAGTCTHTEVIHAYVRPGTASSRTGCKLLLPRAPSARPRTEVRKPDRSSVRLSSVRALRSEEGAVFYPPHAIAGSAQAKYPRTVIPEQSLQFFPLLSPCQAGVPPRCSEGSLMGNAVLAEAWGGREGSSFGKATGLHDAEGERNSASFS